MNCLKSDAEFDLGGLEACRGPAGSLLGARRWNRSLNSRHFHFRSHIDRAANDRLDWPNNEKLVQSSKLFPSELRTVHSFAFVIVLIDSEIRKLFRHYPARSRAFDDGVFRKVLDTEMSAEEVFV